MSLSLGSSRIARGNKAPRCRITWADGFEGGLVPDDTDTGTTLGTLVGHDPDSDSVTFTKVADPDSKFTIDGSALKLSASISVEHGPYTVTVRSTDTHGAYTDRVFTVLSAPGGGGGEEELEALVSANFVTGVYEVAGVSVPVADIVSPDIYEEEGGPGLEDILEPDGLNPRVPGSDAAAINGLLGALARTGGATVIMEWLYVNTSATILFLDEGATFGDHGPDVYYNGTQFRVTRNLGEVEITSAGQDGIVVGRNRVAFTYTPTETSFSLNGQAVVTSGTSISQPTIDKATIGSIDGSNEVNSHIRLIEVYEPQPAASLPGLSAL
jgi:hypothetical protein